MKKIALLILAVIMLVSFAACMPFPIKPSVPTPSFSFEIPEIEIPSLKPVPVPSVEPSTEPPMVVPSPSEEPSPVPSPSEEPKDEFSRGTVVNNVYENEFLGLGLALSDEWTFYSESQLQDLNNGNVVFDMMATNGTGASVNINFEYGGIGFGKNADVDSILDSTVAELPTSLEASGISDVQVQRTYCDIAGSREEAIVVKGIIASRDFYEGIVYLIRGDYACAITVGGFDTALLDGIIDDFYPLR